MDHQHHLQLTHNSTHLNRLSQIGQGQTPPDAEKQTMNSPGLYAPHNPGLFIFALLFSCYSVASTRTTASTPKVPL